MDRISASPPSHASGSSQRLNPSPYSPSLALSDLPAIKHAASLFLGGHMAESEEYCVQVDENGERLYIQAGYSLIQCLKALMSYEDQDLQEALVHLKRGNAIASQHRAPSPSLGSRITGFVMWAGGMGESAGPGVEAIRNMTPVQRHAELLFAETTFAKALVGIVCSGSWLRFIAEALSFRTTINIYLTLESYISFCDSQAPGGLDSTIDADFRSGVKLGVGASNMILSLMPDKVISLVELFGYKGERTRGLGMLAGVGGWKGRDYEPPNAQPFDPAVQEPSVSVEQEGLRRSLADIALLCFHLVLSEFTYRGVDTDMARGILRWNLKRYPDGIFWHFFHAHLLLKQSQPELAIAAYERTLSPHTSDASYPDAPQKANIRAANLHFLSYYEMAICYLALWNLRGSLEMWKKLRDGGASWSRACYAYGYGVSLLGLCEEGADAESIEEMRAEAINVLSEVPSLVHKIAGKSIPLEKFISRKSRKFASQRSRLTLPALEMAYMLQGIACMPRSVLAGRVLGLVTREARNLDRFLSSPRAKPTSRAGNGSDTSDGSGSDSDGDQVGDEYAGGYESYGGEHAFWDDWCLAKFLEGAVWRYLAYPDKNATPETSNKADDGKAITKAIATENAFIALKSVCNNGKRIKLDHWITYHAHYELGRLYALTSDNTKAREHLELVTSGRKGKYSMQSALAMRTNAELESLNS